MLPEHVAAKYAAGLELAAIKCASAAVDGNRSSAHKNVQLTEPCQASGNQDISGCKTSTEIAPHLRDSVDNYDLIVGELARSRKSERVLKLEIDQLRREIQYFYQSTRNLRTLSEVLVAEREANIVIQELENTLAVLKPRIAYLEGSRSWRVTSGLRAAYRWIKSWR
jgi:hypothetical protein